MDAAAKERLTKMLEDARSAHDKFYGSESHDYEAQPMYFLSDGKGKNIVVVLADFPDDGDAKVALANEVGKIAKEHECDGYVFNCESWTIPQGANRTPGERFRDRDDRVETLMVEARLDTQDAAMQMALITRTPGQPPQLDWQEPMLTGEQGGEIRSRLNIFKPGHIDDPEFPDNRQHNMEQVIHALLDRLAGRH